MNEHDVQTMYTEKISLYHFLFYTLLRHDRGGAAFLRKYAPLRSNMRILDAGCGAGPLTQTLYDHARAHNLGDITFHAFDLTQAMLDRFQRWIDKTQATSIQLHQANILATDALPKDWEHYDLIVSSSMMEYLSAEEMVAALASLASRLNPDGLLIFYMTRRNFLTDWLVARPWKANTYSHAELEQALADAGFGTTDFKLIPWPYRYLSIGTHAVLARKQVHT